MSGLLAILPADEHLAPLANGLSYRGVGQAKTWLTDGVGFGYCPSPLTAKEPPAQVIMSGWLFHTNELASLLQCPEASQEALLYQAYQKWGLDLCTHLQGEFSFVLWDSRRKRLVAATDPFGTQPLFWCRSTGGTTLLSNCLNTLRKHPQVSREWNRQAINDFLLYSHNTDHSSTEYQQIQRLPPAHILSLENGTIRIERYWSLQPKAYKRRSASDTVEEFREVFSSVIRSRLKAGRLSFDLSGGIDSTANLVTAKELGTGSLQALTTSFRHSAAEYEATLAIDTARELQVPHSEIVLDSEAYPVRGQWMNRLLLCCSDSPEMEKYKVAAQFGPVLVSGDGGDPAFASSGWQDLEKPFWEKLLLYLWALSQHLQVWGLQAAGLGLKTRLFPPRPRVLEPAPWLKLERVPPRGMSGFWPDLFSQQDSAAHGRCLHVSFPYFDRRLLEFLGTVPPVPWCRKKALARLALRGRVSEQIVCRPKTNAPAYHNFFQQWMCAGPAALESLFQGADERCSQFLDLPTLQRWTRQIAGLSLQQQRQLLAALSFLRWSAQDLGDEAGLLG